MKRILALSAVLALSGCVSSPEYVESDFTYEDINNYSEVGVSAASKAAGRTIVVFATCTEETRRYVISSTGTYSSDGAPWTVRIGGNNLFVSDTFYEDEAEFLAAVSAIEVVGPIGSFGGQERMPVSSLQMQRIPELCKGKQAQIMAYMHDVQEKEIKNNDRLISDVVNRTGAQPMLPGSNQMDFNNLARLFQKDGASQYQGKFVWAGDGDYRVAQVIGDKALLISMTNPGFFPAITIISGKQVLEGQFWSSVSRGPLQFIGVSTYQTVLGASRQTILFKSI